jgi:hypothetical protein
MAYWLAKNPFQLEQQNMAGRPTRQIGWPIDEPIITANIIATANNSSN